MKNFLRINALLVAAVCLSGNLYAVTPETIEVHEALPLVEDAQAVGSAETASSVLLPSAEPTSLAVEAVAAKRNDEAGKKKEKRDWGRLSGSFETNTIYYVEDNVTNGRVPRNSYGSNNYLKVDYQYKRFQAGVQLEYYPHPLVGTPADGHEGLMEGFGWGNLAGKYVSWVDRSFSVTLGDFYEQFGSGLILRSWEDRTLNINNSIGGGRVTFNVKDILGVKLIYGFPRFYMEYLSNQIAGGDLSLSLSNALGLTDHMLTLEGSVVNRHDKNLPEWYMPEDGVSPYDYTLSKNILSYSGRINYEWQGLQAKFEYVGRGKDAFYPLSAVDYQIHRGSAQLAELGYTGSGFAVSAQFRRLRYMESQLFRQGAAGPLDSSLGGNTLNYIPGISTQHSYMLGSLYPLTPNLMGEMGGQIDAFYTFKRGTAIGGKRGLKLHANFSMVYTLDGATTTPGTNFMFRDFTFDIDKSWNKRLRTVLFVSLQKSDTYATGHNLSQNIFVADVTYKFTSKFSLRAELQYNYAPGTGDEPRIGGDWVAGLLEANFAPKWSIFFSDMYNNGNPGEKINYYSGGASFTHSFIRVALSYGRNRAGMICSGGVCRMMPAYTGGNLQVSLTF